MEQVFSLLQAAICFGTVIMFGAAGEILTEKTGNLNLGVPGLMYLGGIAGLAGSFFYESSTANPSACVCILVAMLCALAASGLGALLYSFLTVTLRANQNVTGLTLTIFGSGIANFFGGSLSKMAGGVGQINIKATSAAFRTTLPFLSQVSVFSALGFMVYLAIILCIILQYFLNKTRTGLSLRAVGENPGTADAAGISVNRFKYLATCIGGMISGLGGLYYVVDYTKGTWANDGTIEALGWMAVALVIFARWKPVQTIWGAYLFGVLYRLVFFISGLGRRTMEIFKMLPYAVTIAVLIVVSIRNKRENQPPAALGLAYFREER